MIILTKREMFEKGKVTRTIFKLGVPLILGQIVYVLYNIVDRIFIGNMSGVGKEALAGVGFSFPVVIITIAFSALFGFGGAPLAVIKLGEQKKEEARNIMVSSFLMLLFIGSILMLVLLLFGEQLLFLFGITEELLKYGHDYLSIYAFGTVFVMISVGLIPFVANQGHTKTAAFIVLSGAVLNIILDPILIYTLGMGVKGAAIATVFSQGVSAILVILFLRSKKPALRLSFKGFKLDFKVVLKTLSLGVSPFIMQSTEALIQIVFNTRIVKYGGSNYIDYINIMTIMLSVLQFMTLQVHGLTQGASPLISYNYGSDNKERVKEVYKKLTIIAFIYSFTFYIIIFIFPKQIVGIFNNDPNLIAMSPRILRIFFLGMGFFGIQLATQASFMALGQALVSLSMAVLRKIVILIPLTYILPGLMGIDGIFFAEMIADFIATITTFTVFVILINKILAKKELEINQETE